MKTPRPSSLQHHLPPAILAGSLLAVYGMTLAPGLSWANGGSDAGDLITAAATGGVPHPTGYPLYLILARLFQYLPLGSLAFRTNLMSAVFAALAAMLVYGVVMQARLHRGAAPAWPAGMLSGYAFGLAPLVWSQAVITEVYALHAFLVTLVLYLYTVPLPASSAARRRLDGWRGLALGLAMGNHVTSLLIVPAALVMGSISQREQPEMEGGSPRRSWFEKLILDRGALLRQLAAFAGALSLYLMIPLRALAHPPVNWGNAITPARLRWLVSGELYQGYYLRFDLLEAWGRLQPWAALFLSQFGLPILVLGLIGLFVFGRASRLYALTVWTALAFLLFALFYGPMDSYVYLIPTLVSFAIWAGLGLSGLTQQWSRRSHVPAFVLGSIVIGYFAARALTFVRQVDASRDQRAEAFGREVLAAAPRNAMVFAGEDHSVFTLWYFHFALGERPDLAIVAADLLHFDWYVETLNAQYPALEISAPLPWPETIIADNPLRPYCYLQYTDRSELDCTSPGNPDGE